MTVVLAEAFYRKSISRMAADANENHNNVLAAVTASENVVDSLAQEHQSQRQLMAETHTWSQSVAHLISR